MSAAALTVLLTITAIALALVALERGPHGGRDLALVAALGAVAAAGRVLTAGIPSVQPVTVTCLVAGAALGVRAGLAVGPVAALVSNGFLGHGPWTPGQMAVWAMVGLSGALLGDLLRRPWLLAAVAGAWGVLFGWAMNLWELATFGPEVSWPAFVASSGRSVPFEIAGAIGNVAFALAAGPALLRLLTRYAVRSRVELSEGSPVTSSGCEVAASIDSTRARSSRWLKGFRM